MIKKIKYNKSFPFYFIPFFFIILLFLYFFYYIKKPFFPVIQNIDKYRIIWMYWENKPHHTKPAYLTLCHKTIIKNATGFQINLLNENSVYNFLPNLRKEINLLTIPQKADYIRLALLNKFGGLWFDSDTILFQNPEIIVNKLKHFDFTGFGCHQSYCKQISYGYPKPANWVMASRKHSKLTELCLKNADVLLDIHPPEYFNTPQNYHIFGRKLLWKSIHILLLKNKWDYFHFPSFCLDRDSKNEKLTNDRYISQENIDNKCMNKMLFSPFYSTSPGFPEWFQNMSEDEILENSMLVSKMFRNALSK
jgi:hypothetical protein